MPSPSGTTKSEPPFARYDIFHDIDEIWTPAWTQADVPLLLAQLSHGLAIPILFLISRIASLTPRISHLHSRPRSTIPDTFSLRAVIYAHIFTTRRVSVMHSHSFPRPPVHSRQSTSSRTCLRVGDIPYQPRPPPDSPPCEDGSRQPDATPTQDPIVSPPVA